MKHTDLPTTRRRLLLSTAALLLLPHATGARAQAAFDHSHAAWTALLSRHVKVAPDGKSSRVDYRGFAADRAALTAYLRTLSAVEAAEFRGWSKPQQYAFLANAYNAFTIEKVLTRYPDLKSIRDFGRVIGNPWKDRFFTLLGHRARDDARSRCLRRAACARGGQLCLHRLPAAGRPRTDRRRARRAARRPDAPLPLRPHA